MTNGETKQLAVLVVEDERDYAELLATVLEGEGHKVEYAVDGVDALERVRARRPDLITLDIQMPHKGGVLFYRELKSDPRFVSIPVVVVTGITKDDRDMDTFVRAFLEVEHLPMPDAYVEKPVDNDEFIRIINDAIGTGQDRPDSPTMEEVGFALARTLPTSDYDAAVEHVREALMEEGFGVITEIDVKETLKKKLDLDFQRYVILGACNSGLAYQALTEEPFIGVLLPCNVVVMERAAGGSTVVAFDPTAAFKLVDNSSIEPIGIEVEKALRRALSRLGSS